MPPLIEPQLAAATSLRQMTTALVVRVVKTPFGGERRTATQVRRVLARHVE